MHMFHFDPNNLPEDMPQELKDQITHQQMQNAKSSHDEAAFLEGLDEDSLKAFRGILLSIASAADEAAMACYYIGVSTQMSTKFGTCLACGRKHDEELANMTGPGNFAPNPALMEEYQVESFEEGVRCIHCKYQYVSLEDRMLRKPGPDGCHGCQHKAKFG